MCVQFFQGGWGAVKISCRELCPPSPPSATGLDPGGGERGTSICWGTDMCHSIGYLFPGDVFSQGILFANFVSLFSARYKFSELAVYAHSGCTFFEFLVPVFSQGTQFWDFFVFSQGQGVKPRLANPRPSCYLVASPPGFRLTYIHTFMFSKTLNSNLS